MIPLLITQTWRNATLPAKARPFAESWRRLNPEFEYRLFDDEACAELVADAFPDLVKQYLALPFPVMRADIFRYAMIYWDGGIYADIDMECVRPVGALLQNSDALLSTEARLTPRRQHELGYARPFQIANCICAARPGEPFFKAAVERAISLSAGRPDAVRGDIEDLTGPRMLTRLFYERAWPGVSVLRQIGLMAPRHYPDVWPLNMHVHARHHFFGQWKERSSLPLARRWVERDLWPNPFPSRLVDDSFAEPARPSTEAS